MQKSQLKPGTIYAIKRSTYSRSEPGLLLRAETWHSHTDRELGRHEFAGFKMGPAQGFYSRYSKPAEGNPVLRVHTTEPMSEKTELNLLQKVAEVALTRKIVGGKNVERYFGFEGFKGEFFIELRPSRQIMMSWADHVEEEQLRVKAHQEAQQRKSDRTAEVAKLVSELTQLTGDEPRTDYGMYARFSRDGMLGGLSVDLGNGKISGISLETIIELVRRATDV